MCHSCIPGVWRSQAILMSQDFHDKIGHDIVLWAHNGNISHLLFSHEVHCACFESVHALGVCTCVCMYACMFDVHALWLFGAMCQRVCFALTHRYLLLRRCTPSVTHLHIAHKHSTNIQCDHAADASLCSYLSEELCSTGHYPVDFQCTMTAVA